MPFNDYDTFILAKPLADPTVPVGTRGVVLMTLGGEPAVYEVEFPNGNGGNLGKDISYTITVDHMKPDSTKAATTTP